MLHGDISNQRSYVFGFRFENSLVKFRDHTFLDAVLNFVLGKISRAEIDQEVFAQMKYIYWNTEYTVMLVVDDEVYKSQSIKDYIEDLPFNQVLNIASVSQVTMMLNTGEMNYYIDNCDETRYKVQSKYAITSQELNAILHRQYGRLT